MPTSLRFSVNDNVIYRSFLLSSLFILLPSSSFPTSTPSSSHDKSHLFSSHARLIPRISPNHCRLKRRKIGGKREEKEKQARKKFSSSLFPQCHNQQTSESTHRQQRGEQQQRLRKCLFTFSIALLFRVFFLLALNWLVRVGKNVCGKIEKYARVPYVWRGGEMCSKNSNVTTTAGELLAQALKDEIYLCWCVISE